MRKVLEFRNDFHGTVARANATCTRGGEYYLHHRQVLRLRHKLCGITSCTCGGHLSERGPQPGQPTITPEPDGGVTLDYGI